ncbi:hypothetical protein REG_1367 [Candidatus Regiella insecticola LSR1]|uniref:CS1 type fimbrial major subunit n=1 Tax=Candidatus Regiella insecticola LSR1 TaxID=663321 RepID=E0WTK7_9ENTR|nr:CS1 type fimbrial major subunit [Candidatus Regiella insecticola]EFL91892.1 hypothetical protein REG_1367 [Candidatus Regiella insecticola LSR1]
MKNTMVKNKTLLASAILALTAFSSGAYAQTFSQDHTINLLARITPVVFEVKPTSDLESQYELTFNPAARTLGTVDVPFTHVNTTGKAINARLTGEAVLTDGKNNTIPLSIYYNGVEISHDSSSAVVDETTSATRGNANLKIQPVSLNQDTTPSGNYTGEVTVTFESDV